MRSSTWVFKTFWIDFCVFVAPLILGFIAAPRLPDYDDFLFSSLTIYGVLHIALNTGHVFTTLFPAFYDREIRQRVGVKFWLHPTLFILGFGVLYVVHFEAFKFFFAIYGFYHVFMQHLTWLKTLQRREQLPEKQRKFEIALFLTLVLVPLISWSSGQLIPNPSYFYQGDINLNNPILDLSFLAPTIAAVLVTYLSYLVFSFRRDLKSAPWGKIILLATLYVWLFGGLIFLKSSTFFFIYIISTHSGSYYFYIARGWNSDPQSNAMPPPKIFTLLIVAPLLGALWVGFWAYGELWMPAPILYFQWIHAIAHYALDGVLWRGTSRRAV